MQVCPECGTQYEDHVPTCIADGMRLAPVKATPQPPPKRSPPPPALAPPRRRNTLPFLLLIPIGGLGVFMLALAIGIVWSQISTQPVAQTPAPVPIVAKAPPPPPEEPKELPPIDIFLVSNPSGAGVYENEQFVCETPCAVQHPPHAPLPRFFVFKASGYKDETYEMMDAKGPIEIQMKRQKGAPAPSPAPAVPRPNIGRDR